MDSAKDQPPVSKLRYPLRSASKPRDGKIVESVVCGSSSRKTTKPIMSKSISALELSVKDKTPRPSRRFSIPSSSSSSITRPPSTGGSTPTSKHLPKRQDLQPNNAAPASDTSKSLTRKKFNALSSVSYWLSQIKLSESSSKHSVSLGFFKLALESECEPLERVREELRAYARRHKILELGEPAREILQSYNLLEEVEALSQVDHSELGQRKATSPDDVSILRATAAPRNGLPASKSKVPAKKNRVDSGPKSHKPGKVNASAEKSTPTTGPKEPVVEANKENVDHELVEEANPGLEMETM